MECEMTKLLLRRWQTDALDTYTQWETTRRGTSTFTAAVTTGAGKTIFGAAIADYLLKKRTIDDIIITAPSNTILSQWRQALALFALEDCAQYVTYSWIQANQSRFADITLSQYKVLVIHDEIHHAGEGSTWGNLIRLGRWAKRRLMLTGTPFRDDEAKLPYVRYVKHELRPDYLYSYGDALRDGYVRPLTFYPYDAVGGLWKLKDSIGEGGFTDSAKPDQIQRALNNCLSPKHNWLKTVLTDANIRVMELRETVPNAAGIVTCKDQSHARKVAALLQQISGYEPVLALSDNPASDAHLRTFRDNITPWLVVVKKGSEGLDIPRLRVGVWASNVTKRLSFLQFIGRVMRPTGSGEMASIFMPGHPALIRYALSIEDMVLHVVSEQEKEEAAKRNGGESSTPFEPLGSEAAAGTPIIFGSEGDALSLLIQIQQMAAAGIAQAAMGNLTQVADQIESIRKIIGTSVLP
jgi:superfamily II DNA or RNA helicase